MDATDILKKDKGVMTPSKYNQELVYYEDDVIKMIEEALAK